MNITSFCLKVISALFLLILSSCGSELPMPLVRKTDVIIEGRITSDGGFTPMPNMKVTLLRDRPLSLDVDELNEKTDANGYYRFKFKANHELNERTYSLYYNIYDVDNDIYFCPSNSLSIGILPSADTTLVYNFQIPRKTKIKCVYRDPLKARELELNTLFRFTCGLDSDNTRFLNETGAVSMDYTEAPLYIPAGIPVIVVTRGFDRKQSKAIEKLDTIVVTLNSDYLHQIDF